jgi:SRSO17 transposase
MVDVTDARQLAQIADWQEELAALQQRIAPRFRRREVRERVGRYLTGLMGPVERRNGWQLAEHLGERTPDGVQRLLRTARWDADAVRDDLRAYVVEHLGDSEAVLILDETGFLKKGRKSAGVARQYSGTAGRIENCQIGVFLAYASPHGHAFLDRALYLPKEWTDDRERCRAAGIPDAVTFATKPALAKAMLARAFAAQVPAAWVTADSVYGNDSKLRFWLQEQQQPYVFEVTSNHMVWNQGVQQRVATVAAGVPDDGWVRLTVAAGSKGPRVYDWALARLPYDSAPGFSQWLLVRRALSDPTELAYYRVFGSADTTRQTMAKVAGTRWVIEESFARAKGAVGLDQYEVRQWAAWYRHITLSLLAHAFLEVTRATAGMDGEKGGTGTSFR